MLDFSPNSLINWVIAALVFMGLAQVVLYGLSLYLRFRPRDLEGGERRDEAIRSVSNDLTAAIGKVWGFARPVLQLVVVLLIALWGASQLGLTKDGTAIFAGDIKSVLAFLVIGAFCLAAFLSENPASWLKDLALVVIGFYFGTQVKG